MILLLFFLCFIFAAFFSGAEMAFISSNKLLMRHLADQKKREAEILLSFHRRIEAFLAFILIGNNLMHVSAAALLTFFLSQGFGYRNEYVVALVLTPLMVIFAETIPKDYCRQRADKIIYRFAPVLRFLYRIFYPLTAAFMATVSRLLGPLESERRENFFVTRKEFRSVLDEGVRQGALEEHERRLMDVILDFENIRVEKAMVPLDEVSKIELGKKVGDLKELVRRTGDAFVLVYEEVPAIVVGVIAVFDILFEMSDSASLGDFLRPPLFLEKGTSAEKAFLKLQSTHRSIAVVVDERHEVVGTVAIENILAF